MHFGYAHFRLRWRVLAWPVFWQLQLANLI